MAGWNFLLVGIGNVLKFLPWSEQWNICVSLYMLLQDIAVLLILICNRLASQKRRSHSYYETTRCFRSFHFTSLFVHDLYLCPTHPLCANTGIECSNYFLTAVNIPTNILTRAFIFKFIFISVKLLRLISSRYCHGNFLPRPVYFQVIWRLDGAGFPGKRMSSTNGSSCWPGAWAVQKLSLRKFREPYMLGEETSLM